MSTATLNELIQPLGGLFARLERLATYRDEPEFDITVAELGDITGLLADAGRADWVARSAPVDGSGVGLNSDDSRLLAAGESLERYCSSFCTEEQFIWASARELGRDALDLDTIPRCSRAELSNPRCPLVAPDKDARIRWIPGVSLLSGRATYLPAVMVYLYAGFATPKERIALSITTGCAAHTSYELALASAICEIVERDAISILWLQMLGLPRIEIDCVPPPLAPCWDRYQRGSSQLEYVFFDATTDIGIPTVYGVQLSMVSKRLSVLVACSTHPDPAVAVSKVIRDMASCRISFRVNRPIPARWEDFKQVSHGAIFMAARERAAAFDFLLKSGRTKRLSEMQVLDVNNEKEALRAILDRLRAKNLDVFAVDLSTDEAIRSGARVVRAVIPGLQPLSFNYRARFLGHPRLYEAPNAMGYTARDEGELNVWPQPFS